MIRIRRSTTTALTAAFLLPTLLIAGTKALEAAPIEHRSINKSVKDFPEKTDLSTPESALAAWSRSCAHTDIQAMLELSWVKLDPQFATQLANDLKNFLTQDPAAPKNFNQQIVSFWQACMNLFG